MQILRAMMDMPAGTELSSSTGRLSPWNRTKTYRKKVLLKGWGFSCDCELCRGKKATSADVLKRRKALSQLFKTMKEPGPIKASKVLAIIKKMEETYLTTTSSNIRLELSESCWMIGHLLLSAGKTALGAKMMVKGFEVLGFSFTAHLIAKGSTPQLEVERWGLLTEMAPWAFLRLSEA